MKDPSSYCCFRNDQNPLQILITVFVVTTIFHTVVSASIQQLHHQQSTCYNTGDTYNSTNTTSTCFCIYDCSHEKNWNHNFTNCLEVENTKLMYIKMFPYSDSVGTDVKCVTGQQQLPTTVYFINGAGLRSFSFFPFSELKIYVASLYISSPSPSLSSITEVHPYSFLRVNRATYNTTESIFQIIRNNQNGLNIERHLLFQFTFLRNIDEHYVKKAWKYQLQHSIHEQYTSYSKYQHDRAAFLSAFGPINDKHDRTVSIHLISNGTTMLYDVGTGNSNILHKNRSNKHVRKRITAIHDSFEFQYAFCSMWFGQQPVALELKENLLSTVNSSFYKNYLHHLLDHSLHYNSNIGTLQDNEVLVKLNGS